MSKTLIRLCELISPGTSKKYYDLEILSLLLNSVSVLNAVPKNPCKNSKIHMKINEWDCFEKKLFKAFILDF